MSIAKFQLDARSSATDYLHGDDTLVHGHFFCEEIRAYRCLVLIAEFFVDKLVHERGLAHAVDEAQWRQWRRRSGGSARKWSAICKGTPD